MPWLDDPVGIHNYSFDVHCLLGQPAINIPVKSNKFWTCKSCVCAFVCSSGPELKNFMDCHTIKENKTCIVFLVITC